KCHVSLLEPHIPSLRKGGERRIQMLTDRSDRGGDRVPVMTVTRCGGHGSAERRGQGHDTLLRSGPCTSVTEKGQALPECPGARASAKSRCEKALSIQLTQSPRRPQENGKLRAETTNRMDSAVSTALISCGACNVRDVDYKKTPMVVARVYARREYRRRRKDTPHGARIRPSRACPRCVSDRSRRGATSPALTVSLRLGFRMGRSVALEVLHLAFVLL